VATIWECALRKPEQVDAAAERLAAWLVTESDTLELGEREVSSV
jgi:DNA mismatch endonuclease (patch repair protein)